VVAESRGRQRPQLFLLVYGVSLAMAAVTAVGLAVLVGAHVERGRIETTVDADRVLLARFVGQTLRPGDLDGRLNAGRQAELTAALDDMRRETGLLSISLVAADGSELLSAGLRSPTDGGTLAAALDGQLDARIVDGQRLVEALPILVDGRVAGAAQVSRDAAPITAQVDAVWREVVVVVGVATLGLALLLALVFRAAQVRISRQASALVAANHHDALTGLTNHGTAVADLAACLEGARRTGGWIEVALIDVDNFRLLNDSFGFETGDCVLRELAVMVRREAPDEAIVGRFGADELIIIGPPSCAHEIRPAVDRVRQRLGALAVRSASGEKVPVTVSVGISSYPEHAGAVTELLSAATVTLGRAKASGGDAVELDAPDIAPAAGQRSFDVLQGLVLAIDTKDRYTKRHSEDVARYAILLGRRLGLDDGARRAFQLAGLLHDVGKIGIPDDILRKPTMLSADERAIVEQHVIIGDLIVRDLPSVDLVRAGVRYHHERWDGSGYPDGLAGDEIPRIARVVAVADSFSAMTTTRAYRKALEVAEAVRRLEDAAGTQLDPALVRLFVEAIAEPSDTAIESVRQEALWRPLEGAA